MNNNNYNNNYNNKREKNVVQEEYVGITAEILSKIAQLCPE